MLFMPLCTHGSRMILVCRNIAIMLNEIYAYANDAVPELTHWSRNLVKLLKGLLYVERKLHVSRSLNRNTLGVLAHFGF